MPRFLDALRSSIQPEPITLEPIPQSYSTMATTLQHFLNSIQSHLPHDIKSTISEFAKDKSQSELVFLLSIVLAVLLFVVILPLCETLFGDDDDYDVRNNEGKEQCYEGGSMRMYKPGVGIVTMDVEDIAEMTFLRASSGGSGSSSRSVGSHGSWSMETIEESEEEEDVIMEDELIDDSSDDVEELHAEKFVEEVEQLSQDCQEEETSAVVVCEEQEDEGVQAHPQEVVDEDELNQECQEEDLSISAECEQREHNTKPDLLRSMSCPALASSDESQDQIEDDGPDNVKYCEFLNYLNSEASPRNCTVGEETDEQPLTLQSSSSEKIPNTSDEEKTQEHYFVAPTPSTAPQDDSDANSATSELTSSSQHSTDSLSPLRSSIKKKMSKKRAGGGLRRSLKKLSSARW